MKTPLPLSRKTPSYQLHRRQFIWQILAPILIVAILVIAASVFAATRNENQASVWADISLIWLIIPAFFFALILFMILIGLIYAMAMLLKVTPTYTQQLQELIRLAAQKIESAADATAKPIFFLEGISASVRRFFRGQ